MATSGAGFGQVVVAATQDKIIPVQFSIAASAPAGTIVPGTIYAYGLNNNPTGSSFLVPAGSKYQLVDMYVSGSPAVDAQTIFSLNGLPQGENLVLSTINAQVSGRAKITQPLVLGASDVLSISIVTVAANGSTAATETLFLHFLQVPA
jgi:hypothetical protein